jgi:COX assembly protein 1
MLTAARGTLCPLLLRAEFAECSTGRTVSIAWACRGQHKALQNCLKQ